MSAAVLAGVAWAYVAWIGHHTRTELQAQLGAQQQSSRRQLEGWMRERVAQVEAWAHRGDVQELARQALALRHAPADQLAALPALAAFRAEFALSQGRQGTPGFLIVSPEGRNLATIANDNLGARNPVWDEPEFVRSMRQRGSALSPLMPADVPLENVGAVLDDVPLTLFVGVPLRLSGPEPDAYLLLRLNVASLIAVQGQTRFRMGGISYLVDGSGRVHADRTWVNVDLAHAGLRGEYFRGKRYLFARDPGHDLTAASTLRPGTEVRRAELPLTHSARQLQYGDGFSLDPYRDHRGVPVVGAWSWSEVLGLGLVTEISADEAFSPIEAAYKHVLIATLAVAGAMVLLLFARLRHSRQRMQEAMERAEAANKAKSAFLANMSHEIRTPLNAVLGIAHLLGNTPLAPSQREYLSIISESGQTLLGILNDILDYSKVEAGKLELASAEFELHAMMDTLASIMSINAAPKDLELIVGIDPSVPSLLVGDSHRLLQILINLTGNAIKFTPQGDVVVHVSLQQHEGQGVGGRAQVRFEVVDSGVGISPEKQALLFAPFMQADARVARSFGGTGLGLAICKRLVDLMHGEIGVDSAQGRGSRFWFVVPLGVGAQPEPAPRAPGPIRRVLVVDDNAMAREFVGTSVDRLGWAATMADSGSAALAQLHACHDARGEAFDVLLIDWKMPGMDGLQTSSAVRAIEGMAQPPIVVMVTAFGREEVQRLAPPGLIDAVISKPATPSKILDAVMEAQAQRAQGLPALRPGYAPARVVNRLKGLRILLVEDNFINQQVARGMLAAEGAVVSTVDNGADAIARLTREAQAFDLVLMDVQMPVMDGIEATRRLRREHQLSLPIVAMSAGVTPDEQAQCSEAGMNGFIAKPLEPQAMVRTLRALDLRPGAGAAGVDAEGRVAVAPGPAAAPAAAADEALPEHIDGLDLQELKDTLNGNRAAVARLLDRLAVECGKAVVDLDRALGRGDWVEFAALVHGFKGMAANMRAAALAQQAESVEAALRRDDHRAVGELFPHFRADVLSLQARLQQARAARA